jgi:hypothetical protein
MEILDERSAAMSMRSRSLLTMRRNHLPLLMLIAFLLLSPGTAASAEAPPPQWPWKGITVSVTAAKPGTFPSKTGSRQCASAGIECSSFCSAPEREAGRMVKNPEWTDHMLDACRQAVSWDYQHLAISHRPSLKINQESPEFWNDSTRLSKRSN